MKSQDDEKRKHERFKVEGRAFIILPPGHNRVGRLTDISLGGLGFWYLEGKRPSEELTELDIYLDDFHYLGNIPCKLLYDAEIIKEFPANPMAKKKMGVQFGKLTIEQISRLEEFIRNNTPKAKTEDDT